MIKGEQAGVCVCVCVCVGVSVCACVCGWFMFGYSTWEESLIIT